MKINLYYFQAAHRIFLSIQHNEFKSEFIGAITE